MADIHVITKDGQEIYADSYSFIRHDGMVILRFYNPESCDDMIEYAEGCDFGTFDITAEYPGRKKEHHFVGYELANCVTEYKSAGTVLEIYLRKLEVV